MSHNDGNDGPSLVPPDHDPSMPLLDEATAHLDNLPADISAWFPHDPEEINRIVQDSFQNIRIPNTRAYRDVEEEDDDGDAAYSVDSDHDEETARVIRAALEKHADDEDENGLDAGTANVDEMDELAALLEQDLTLDLPQPPANIPSHFPAEMYQPYEEPSGGVDTPADGANASATSNINTNINSNDIAGDCELPDISNAPDMADPIARRQRDNMRHLYGDLQDAEIDEQVQKFMQELSDLNAMPTFVGTGLENADPQVDLDNINLDLDFDLGMDTFHALKNLEIEDLAQLETNPALLNDFA